MLKKFLIPILVTFCLVSSQPLVPDSTHYGENWLVCGWINPWQAPVDAYGISLCLDSFWYYTGSEYPWLVGENALVLPRDSVYLNDYHNWLESFDPILGKRIIMKGYYESTHWIVDSLDSSLSDTTIFISIDDSFQSPDGKTLIIKASITQSGYFTGHYNVNSDSFYSNKKLTGKQLNGVLNFLNYANFWDLPDINELSTTKPKQMKIFCHNVEKIFISSRYNNVINLTDTMIKNLELLFIDWICNPAIVKKASFELDTVYGNNRVVFTNEINNSLTIDKILVSSLDKKTYGFELKVDTLTLRGPLYSYLPPHATCLDLTELSKPIFMPPMSSIEFVFSAARRDPAYTNILVRYLFYSEGELLDSLIYCDTLGTRTEQSRSSHTKGRTSLTVSSNPIQIGGLLDFTLPENSRIKLSILTIDGKLLYTIKEDYVARGSHSIRLNKANLPNGNYLLRLETAYSVSVKRITLLN